MRLDPLLNNLHHLNIIKVFLSAVGTFAKVHIYLKLINNDEYCVPSVWCDHQYSMSRNSLNRKKYKLLYCVLI